jgi:hypothetical protein
MSASERAETIRPSINAEPKAARSLAPPMKPPPPNLQLALIPFVEVETNGASFSLRR